MTVAARAAETVVLLHGLGRTSWSMSHLARTLERDGYRVVNLSYPSRSLPLEQLATEWLPRTLRERGVDLTASADSRVHVVTHSMGGILLRLYLRDHPDAALGRVVMLAPPNAGSELSDRMNAFPPFRWFTGVNGRRLGTDAASLPRTLGPWPTHSGQLGVIAGTFSWNPLFASWLPSPHDGKVSVASTRLDGMTDHIALPYSHTWLAWREVTTKQVVTFLKTGVFTHSTQ